MSAPYMPLFIADYLADTAHLSAAEHGAYLLLIMNYWQRSAPLPADDRKLARIARMTEREWAAARENIAEFFTADGAEWRHSRIDKELAIVVEKSTKAKASARASASARQTFAERTLSERSAFAERTQSYKARLGKARQEAASAACKREGEGERAEPTPDPTPEVRDAATGRAAPDRYAEIEHVCREALGRSAPNDPVIGPIVALIDGGKPLEGVVAVLRGEAARPRRKPIFTWGVWKQIVVERWGEYAAAPAMAHPPDPGDPRVDFGGGFSATLSAIQRAIDRDRWRDEWGPKLGAPGCRVPPELAAKLTVAQAA